MGTLMPTVLGRDDPSSMLCIRPYKPRAGVEFGCGQCLPCRINRRRMWTARIVLESAAHGLHPSAFFTLTYSPQWLPKGGTLVPGDLERFRYRLRHLFGPFRYYFVGEYGEASERPHYHGLLFGLLPSVAQIESCWTDLDSGTRLGSAHVGTLSVDSAAYVAGYVTKKMTSKLDIRLNGRYPEFSRMSRKPGIGSEGLHGIRMWLYTAEGRKYREKMHDVPLGIRFGGKIYPLGRYLVTKLREEFGIDSSDPIRQAMQRARALELCLPEVQMARENRREGQYSRAKFYRQMRQSGAKI